MNKSGPINHDDNHVFTSSIPIYPSFPHLHQCPLQCPCQSAYSTNDEILAALQDTKKTEDLISWFSNDKDEHSDANDERGRAQPLHHKFVSEKSTTTRPASSLLCPHRVTAAYCILNAIRDSCREILEEQQQYQQEDPTSSSKPDTSDAFQNHNSNRNQYSRDNRNTYNSQTHMKGGKLSISSSSSLSSPFTDKSYEESFPSLSLSSPTTTANAAPNILKTRKKEMKKAKISSSSNYNKIIKSTTNTSAHTNMIRNTSNTKNSSPALATKRRIQPVAGVIMEGTNISKKNAKLSPWNTFSTSNHGKKDPMERIMNSKHIIGQQQSDDNKNKPTGKLMSDSAATNNDAKMSYHLTQSKQNQMNQDDKKITTDPPMRSLSPSPSPSAETVISRYDTRIKNDDKIPSDTQVSNESNTGNENKNKSGDDCVMDQDISAISSDTDKNHNTPTSPSTPSSSPEDHPILFQNITNVYISIIQHQLIPSMILELQLILRLLCLGDGNSNHANNDNNNNAPRKKKKKKKKKKVDSQQLSTTEYKMKQLFSSQHSCQQFAIQILIKMKSLLTNLNQEILIPLLRLNNVQILLPKEIIQELHDSIESRMNCSGDGKGGGSRLNGNSLGDSVYGNSKSNRSSSCVEGTFADLKSNRMSFGSMSRSTILNVSFNEKRDSRHHFRSKDLGTLYNNREQCRDVFLFQLRAFQQIRSTIIHPNEINKSILEITRQCKEMIHVTLEARNIPWFVEFFTELLLQIGLVPTQETDADILNNVSDKDKLQKLHSRFTSKVGVVSGATQRNKSSQRLTLDSSEFRQVHTEKISDGGGSISGKTIMTPDQYFTGHQEFFFRFIRFVDSYSFSIHLRNRLVSLIVTMWSSVETKGLEQRIMKLQMLSKFLGVLAFSPNWTEDSNATDPPSLSSGIEDMTTPFIEIKGFLEKGWNQRKLIVTIPWILNFFQMMIWDRLSIRRPYYREIFSLLRAIHKWATSQIFSGFSSRTSNLFLLTLQLESFFSDVVGLGEIECISSIDLPTKYESDMDLDSFDFGFSFSYILSSSTHLEELKNLISDLSRIGGNFFAVTGTSKKLKPFVLSSYPSGVSLSLIGENQLQGIVQTDHSLHNQDANSEILGKMIDSFFHQHKELQPICDFIIELSLKILSKDIVKLTIESKVKNSYRRYCFNKYNETQVKLSDPVDINWYLKMLRHIELETHESLCHDFNTMIRVYIVNAMNAVLLHDFNDRIRDIAIELATKHAFSKGKSIVTSFIRAEVKKNIDEHIKNGQIITSAPHQSPNDNPRLFFSHYLRQLKIIAQDINKFLDSNSSNNNFSNVPLKLVTEVTKELHQIVKDDRKMSNILLRSELETIFKDLVLKFISMLKIWLPLKTSMEVKKQCVKKCVPIGFFETMGFLCELRNANLFPIEIRVVSEHICQKSALDVILSWDDNNYGNLLDLIKEAVTCSLIQKCKLQEALINQLEVSTMTQQVSKHCIHILGILRQIS